MNLDYYLLFVGMKNQPLTIDMTKDKNKERYRSGFNSIFVPDTN